VVVAEAERIEDEPVEDELVEDELVEVGLAPSIGVFSGHSK